jgi:hypothetical protein
MTPERFAASPPVEPAPPAPAPVAAQTLVRIRRLAVLNVFALIVWRLFGEADDLNNWDLIGFLNANSFDSLWRVLQHPDVHLRKPFSFPLYNVGAESVIGSLLFRGIGKVSLYWTNPLALLLFDVVFLVLLHAWIRVTFRDRFGEAAAWLLVGMSPVLLTFGANSVFNMQGYAAATMALLGAELVLQRKLVRGILGLAIAFLFISQGYPLAFFIPYFLAAWVGFRLLAGRLPARPDGTSWPLGRRIVLTIVCVALVAGAMWFVQWMSNGVYLGKISPLRPHDQQSPFDAPDKTWMQFVRFLRQAFWPAELRVDPVPIGYAPYLMWVALLLITVAALLGGGRRVLVVRPVGILGGGLVALGGFGLVFLGYVPSWVNPVLKSQRALFGDLFLAMVTAYWAWRATSLALVSRRTALAILAACLLVADVVYVTSVRRVNHATNHPPIFDFDLSDGPTRHDLIAAIELMRHQVEEEGAGLVVAYPREYSENTTDPGLFFARVLRHWGRYRRNRDVLFPCRTCEFKYGCAFPQVEGKPCANRCCWADPFPRLRHRFPNRPVYVWWHQDMTRSPNAPKLDAILPRLERRWRLQQLTLPPPITGWVVLRLTPRGD